MIQKKKGPLAPVSQKAMGRTKATGNIPGRKSSKEGEVWILRRREEAFLVVWVL